MKLRNALNHSRIFKYREKKYFAMLYPNKKFWTRKKFTVYVSEHPMPDEIFQFSSEINVKPVLRVSENCENNKIYR